MSGKYDFREGMLLDKVVYKNTTCDWRSRLAYFGCMLFCYTWGMGWFSLFFYAYIFHENTTFWVFVSLFIVHMIIVISNGAYVIMSSKKDKANKLKAYNEKLRNEEQIEKNKKKKTNAATHDNHLMTEGIHLNEEKDNFDRKIINTEMQMLTNNGD